jgi:acetoin utilization protein AcuB
MLVKNWMSKVVITVEEKDSMQDAMKLLKKHDIRMLPVVREGKLVGVVTDRDLKKASASDATTLEIHELIFLISEIKIKDIMTKNPVTVPFDYTVEETAEILLKNKISGAPVVDHDGQITGTITQTDLFNSLISLTGVGKRGLQFAFQLEDRPGSIKEVVDLTVLNAPDLMN